MVVVTTVNNGFGKKAYCLSEGKDKYFPKTSFDSFFSWRHLGRHRLTRKLELLALIQPISDLNGRTLPSFGSSRPPTYVTQSTDVSDQAGKEARITYILRWPSCVVSLARSRSIPAGFFYGWRKLVKWTNWLTLLPCMHPQTASFLRFSGRKKTQTRPDQIKRIQSRLSLKNNDKPWLIYLFDLLAGIFICFIFFWIIRLWAFPGINLIREILRL